MISPLRGRQGVDYRVTQKFGARPNIYARFGLKGHDALDFASIIPGEMVPCYACYDGEITAVGYDPNGYGNYFKLMTDRGGDGYVRELLYAHLETIDPRVQMGKRVFLGDQVGIIGTTGFSTGVHLHLSIRKRDPQTGAVIGYDNGYKGRFDYQEFLLDCDTPNS